MPADYVPRLADRIRRFLDIKGYKTQNVPDVYTTVIQAQKVNTIRDLTGFSSEFTIRVWPEGDTIRVQTVSERWLIRAVVTFVCFMVPPLFLVPMIGGYIQFRHVDELWQDISEQAGKFILERRP